MGMGSANERRRYIVTPPLIGWAHTQNYPCNQIRSFKMFDSFSRQIVDLIFYFDYFRQESVSDGRSTMWGRLCSLWHVGASLLAIARATTKTCQRFVYIGHKNKMPFIHLSNLYFACFTLWLSEDLMPCCKPTVTHALLTLWGYCSFV